MDVEGFGNGLVVRVMPLVKSFRLPITPADTFSTPLIIEAAKVEPGKVGKLPEVGRMLGALGLETLGPAVRAGPA